MTWLQRVNPARTLSPQLVASFANDVPALLVGSLAKKPLAAISEIPVTADESGLTLVSRKAPSTLTLSPAVGVGLWQLATLGKHTPAILLDAWGRDGAQALENVSSQMARSVWIESGDVVVGDGATPVLTFATREAALPAAEEMPKPLVAAAPARPRSRPCPPRRRPTGRDSAGGSSAACGWRFRRDCLDLRAGPPTGLSLMQLVNHLFERGEIDAAAARRCSALARPGEARRNPLLRIFGMVTPEAYLAAYARVFGCRRAPIAELEHDARLAAVAPWETWRRALALPVKQGRRQLRDRGRGSG